METAPKVYEAIIAVMAEMAKEGIAKGRKNQQQGYAFRGVDDVYAALSEKLAAHKLCVLPRIITRENIERQTGNGKPIFYSLITAEFDMVSAIDGSKHTICTVGEAMDLADKSSNKAMSAAYKYAMIQAFCIPTEGDNDADATTLDVAPRHQRQQPQRQQPAQRGGRQGQQQGQQGQQQGQQGQQQDQAEQPTTAQIDALKQKLADAAMSGTAVFNRVWGENPGPARKLIMADKAQMDNYKTACEQADRAEGDDAQQQRDAA